jgi:hypothetical protein
LRRGRESWHSLTMENFVYLYQHVPKCGGRSFVHACLHWFPDAHEKVGRFPSDERVAEFARTRLDFDQLPPASFVHGHFVRDGIRPHERYGDHIAAGRCRLLTIVRDPLDRCVSAYFHRRRTGQEWPEPLDAYLRRGRNRTAHLLGVTAENWRERLDGYFLVGTTESLGLAINLMAVRTGNPPVETPHLNVSARDEHEISPETRAIFREKNALDDAIHRYAQDRLAREAAAHGLA